MSDSFQERRERVNANRSWGAGHSLPHHHDLHFPTDNVRSIRLTFPAWSFTETCSTPLASESMGAVSFISHTPGFTMRNLPARFSPGATPSMAKSAVTVKPAGSRPVP